MELILGAGPVVKLVLLILAFFSVTANASVEQFSRGATMSRACKKEQIVLRVTL